MIQISATPGRPRLSVIIVTFGDSAGVRGCLQALVEATEPGFEVIIVDNPHPDFPRPPLDEIQGVTVLRSETNIGFGAGANRGAGLARSDVLCFLNPDTEVEPGWFEILEAAIRRPGVGAAVPLLLSWDGDIQDAGALLSCDGSTVAWGAGGEPDDERYAFAHAVPYGSGACLVIRRDTFAQVAGFAEVYTPAYCEDVDLGRTLASQGLSTVIVPRARVRHRGGATKNRTAVDEMVRRSTHTLRQRWWQDLAHRPSLSGWQQRPHRLIFARDVDTDGRFLIVFGVLPPPGDRVGHLVAELPLRWPRARVTVALMHPDSGDASDLLDAGIEIARRPDAAWFDERRFLYDLIAVEAGIHHQLTADIDRTQPQALVVGLDELTTDPVGVSAAAGIAPTTAAPPSGSG